ncbi:proline-rich protein 2-like [Schistocerca nitens]|uniref:proline-rich protein 2-like n=1 Tax=Schistocerca nitens TaxID=7011 RepID=UPI0021186AD4|nr:proline-rich protein 2-like [Schistocerca nitens]
MKRRREVETNRRRLTLLGLFAAAHLSPEPSNNKGSGAAGPLNNSGSRARKAALSRPPCRSRHLVRGGFQPRLPTSLPPPGQQQQPSPLPRRQPVPLMPPAQLHPGAPQVVAPAPAVPLQSPPPSELMDVDPSAGPPSQAVAVQPVLQPLSLGTPKESDTAAPCPAPTRQPSTQRQETLPLFVGPDAPSRPVPEAAPVVTGVHPDLGFPSVFPEAPRSQCWGPDRGLPPTTVSAPTEAVPAAAAAAPAPPHISRHYRGPSRMAGTSRPYFAAPELVAM